MKPDTTKHPFTARDVLLYLALIVVCVTGVVVSLVTMAAGTLEKIDMLEEKLDMLNRRVEPICESFEALARAGKHFEQFRSYPADAQGNTASHTDVVFDANDKSFEKSPSWESKSRTCLAPFPSCREWDCKERYLPRENNNNKRVTE